MIFSFFTSSSSFLVMLLFMQLRAMVNLLAFSLTHLGQIYEGILFLFNCSSVFPMLQHAVAFFILLGIDLIIFIFVVNIHHCDFVGLSVVGLISSIKDVSYNIYEKRTVCRKSAFSKFVFVIIEGSLQNIFDFIYVS